MNTRIKQTLLALTVISLPLWLTQCAQPVTDNNAGKQQLFNVAELPFSMPEVQQPTFPNYTVNIVDFGAKGDGITLNTQAINDAIKDVNAKGGGKVVIPAGVWLTGPIVLQSNVNLYTEVNALVVFTDDFNAYPIIDASFEGLNTRRCQSPISAYNAENIAITGYGTFDGSGDSWRPVKKGKRPVLLNIVKSKKVLLEGVTFKNSPAWCLHPLSCEHITLNNVKVFNPWYSQNGDALDLESCNNALIINCIFDAGDDAICIKSGKDKDGRDRGEPCQNVIVKNNTVLHGHGGFVVGSEMSGGVKNVYVSDCTFLGTDVGLRFKSTRGRGGVVEGIYINNIHMIDIPHEALLFDLFYGGKGAGEESDEDLAKRMKAAIPPVTEETPAFRDIHISNVVCKGAGRAMFFNGLPEMPVSNINIKDCTITAETGIDIRNSQDITLENVKCHPERGEAVKTWRVRNFTNI